jgi:hypothetical protein
MNESTGEVTESVDTEVSNVEGQLKKLFKFELREGKSYALLTFACLAVSATGFNICLSSVHSPQTNNSVTAIFFIIGIILGGSLFVGAVRCFIDCITHIRCSKLYQAELVKKHIESL